MMSRDCTVLVVDDEPLIRMDLIDQLEGVGCRTFEAGSADEAIKILEHRRDITVVFTDVQMPGSMDGIALAKYVRKRWPPTILVVSSGRAKLEPGILDDDVAFLTKPYAHEAICKTISDVRNRLYLS